MRSRLVITRVWAMLGIVLPGTELRPLFPDEVLAAERSLRGKGKDDTAEQEPGDDHEDQLWYILVSHCHDEEGRWEKFNYLSNTPIFAACLMSPQL